jgi:NCAIR mutase (PurE)-related protein
MIHVDKSRNAEIAAKLQDIEGITQALKKAAQAAILQHARAGLPIVIWRDGQIVHEYVQIDSLEVQKDRDTDSFYQRD